jgi:gluconate kinase
VYAAVFVNGSVGVGKTTVGEAVAEELAARGVAAAFIDVDALRRRRPRRPEDPWQSVLALRNLTAVTSNYRADDVRVVVAAGVAESSDELSRHAAALGPGNTLFVRLVADPTVVAERLRRRHIDDPEGLRWHLARNPELDGVLDTSHLVHDIVLDSGALTPRELTARIVSHVTD